MKRRWRWKWRWRSGTKPHLALARFFFLPAVFTLISFWIGPGRTTTASADVARHIDGSPSLSLWRGKRDFPVTSKVSLRSYVWGSTVNSPTLRVTQGVAGLSARYRVDHRSWLQLGVGVAGARLHILGAPPELVVHPALVAGLGVRLAGARWAEVNMLMQGGGSAARHGNLLPMYKCMVMVEVALGR